MYALLTLGETVKMNFFQAINNALSTALATDETAGMYGDLNDHDGTKVLINLRLIDSRLWRRCIFRWCIPSNIRISRTIWP